MKANELRIGNWVNTYKGYSEVYDVMCDCINTVMIEGIPLGEFDPIPLTEEWLLKFGFSSRKIGHNDFEMDIEYKKDEFNVIKYFGGDFYFEARSIDRNIELKYIHQLQNLYYALTGEELELTKTNKDERHYPQAYQ